MVIAWLYLRYTTPIYTIVASILVRDDTKGTDLGESIMIENFGLAKGKSNLDNEIEILKSRTLMENVVKDLHLTVSYYAKEKVKTTEVYNKSPFSLVIIQPSTHVKFEEPWHLEFKEKQKFKLKSNQHTSTQSFGDTFHCDIGKIVIQRTPHAAIAQYDYSFKIHEFDETVKKYQSVLQVSTPNKQVSILKINVRDPIPTRGEALLTNLIASYLRANINDKNRIADSTISFINQNLLSVSQHLEETEQKMAQFRKRHFLTDPSEQSRLLLSESLSSKNTGNQVAIQLSVIESLHQYISKNPHQIIPSGLSLQSPGYNLTVDKYNTIQLLRSKALLGATETNPTIQNFDRELNRIRQELLDHIEIWKGELQTKSNQIEQELVKTSTRFKQLPDEERQLQNYLRQLQIQEELYSYLLKKRLETSISKSSTTANGRVIDIPKADPNPILPQPRIVLLISILVGLFLPIFYVNLSSIINTCINDKEEIEALTKIPILAQISHLKNTESRIFKSTNRDQPVAEQFRTLRTNLQFIPESDSNKIILISSATSGEGKTFISLNLCHTLQLINKKVILVEFDLRKPKIGSLLKINGLGLTDYLISKIPITDIIHPIKDHHFDAIIAGNIPPNPAELIVQKRTQELLTFLRNHYDYIIIDSPPLNLVTDTKILSPYCDLCLYVIRQNFTHKAELQILNDPSTSRFFPKIYLILNDINNIPSYGYVMKN